MRNFWPRTGESFVSWLLGNVYIIDEDFCLVWLRTSLCSKGCRMGFEDLAINYRRALTGTVSCIRGSNGR
jgi:hypothetical protein